MNKIQGPFVAQQAFGTTINVSLTNPVGGGNSLVVVLKIWDSGTSVNVTDNQSNSYGAADATRNDDINTANTYYFHLSGITNGPDEVNISWTNGAAGYAYVIEYEGEIAFDSSPAIFSGSGVNPVSISYTANEDNSAVLGTVGSASSHTISGITAGWDYFSPSGSYPEWDSGFYTSDAGAAGSKSADLTFATSPQYRLALGLYYSTGGGGPTITDVDTDENIASTQTNVVVTGSGFGASQGTSTLAIIQGSVNKQQPIDSWSDTSIQFDVAFDS